MSADFVTVSLTLPACDQTNVANRTLWIFEKSDHDANGTAGTKLVDETLAKNVTRYDAVLEVGQVVVVMLRDNSAISGVSNSPWSVTTLMLNVDDVDGNIATPGQVSINCIADVDESSSSQSSSSSTDAAEHSTSSQSSSPSSSSTEAADYHSSGSSSTVAADYSTSSLSSNSESSLSSSSSSTSSEA